jgi:polyhydroxybutyrate depolymerase
MSQKIKHMLQNMSCRLIVIILPVCLIVLYTGCKSSSLDTSSWQPGSLERTLKVNGDNRSYRLHIPNKYYNGKPMPLVIALHGAFSSASEMEHSSGFSALADKEGFIVVYPNGIGLLGFLRHWNAGFCCGRAMKAEWNDTGFLIQLIDILSEHLVVDRQRIYMAGMSNGGMLAHRFAVEHPDRIAAVVIVAAAVGARWGAQGEMQTLPHPLLPVPALIIHAKDDPVIPFEGGRGKREDVEYLGPKDAAIFWRKANQCDDLPKETRVPGGVLTQWEAACVDRSEVALLAIDKGGHVWPGGQSDLPPDLQTENGVNGAETAWRFMSRFSRD